MKNQLKLLFTASLAALSLYMTQPVLGQPSNHYQIRPGDTYTIIALKVYGDPSLAYEIYRMNPHIHPQFMPIGAWIKLIEFPTTIEQPTPLPTARPTIKSTPRPTATATPKPLVLPTPIPTPPPIPSPPPLTYSQPEAYQQAYKSKIKLFYQASLFNESLSSQELNINGQAVDGLGASLQLLPHENFMLNAQYQRQSSRFDREVSQEITERTQQEGIFELAYVQPFSKHFSLKFGAGARYNHYLGNTLETGFPELRERDYLDQSFQTIGGELDLGFAYRLSPFTIEGEFSYSPYTQLLFDNSGQSQLQFIGAGLQLESQLFNTSALFGLGYQYKYTFGAVFTQQQHQLQAQVGYQF